jgi:hypothetical protein
MYSCCGREAVFALYKAEFRLMKISSVYVNDLLGNRGREVIWPGANCGGDHVLPATLNVKTEPDVTGRRDEGGEATIAAGQRGEVALRAGRESCACQRESAWVGQENLKELVLLCNV